MAADKGQIDIAMILLEHGASIEDTTALESRRPLMIAALAGNVFMVQFLLREGAQIAAVDRNGAQAIHLASTADSLDILQILIDRGAAVNSSDLSNRTPLHYALESRGCPEVIKLFVNSGADLGRNQRRTFRYSALHLACVSDCGENVRALLTLMSKIGDDNRLSPDPLPQIGIMYRAVSAV